MSSNFEKFNTNNNNVLKNASQSSLVTTTLATRETQATTKQVVITKSPILVEDNYFTHNRLLASDTNSLQNSSSFAIRTCTDVNQIKNTTNSNENNYFTKNLLLSEFWKNHKNTTNKNCIEEKNVIYENLCENCGYGVFEADGKLCNFCEFSLTGNIILNNSNPDKLKEPHNLYCKKQEVQQNIYENICDNCSEIYDGNECVNCLNEIHKKSTSNPSKTVISRIKKTPKIFSGLVGTLKKVRSKSENSIQNGNSVNKSKSLKKDKLTIIHNVDSVFRTQESFDLNRICELKRLQQSNSDQHIYGKLRKSDDHLMSKSTVTKLFGDGNSIRTTENSKSDPTLHTIQSFTSSSPPTPCSSSQFYDYFSKVNGTPFHEQQKQQPKQSRSHQYYCGILQDHVIEWMTSLRQQTHDYFYLHSTDDSICNTKSIPSRNFSCCGLLYETSCIRNQIPSSSSLLSTLSDSRFQLLQSSSQSSSLSSVSQLKSLLSSSNTIPLSNSGENNNHNNDKDDATLRSLFTNDLDYTQMVDNFKKNLMEKQRSKRKAIYLKIEDHQSTTTQIATETIKTQSSITTSSEISNSTTIDSVNSTLRHTSSDRASSNKNQRNNYKSNRYGICERDSDFVSDLLNAFDSFLKRDNFEHNDHQKQQEQHNQPEVLVVDNEIEVDDNVIATKENIILSNNCNNLVPTIQTRNELNSNENNNQNYVVVCAIDNNNCVSETSLLSYNHSNNYNTLLLKFDINRLITNLCLSQSLNRIILCYDKFLCEFLNIKNNEQFVTCKFSQALPIFHKFYADANLFQLKISKRKQRSKTNKRNYCANYNDNGVVALTSSELETKLIFQSPLEKQKQLALPSPSHHLLLTPPITDSSSSSSHSLSSTPAISMTIVQAQKGNKNEDEYNIYQPIWKFQTVGNPRESYASDYYDTTSMNGGYDDDSLQLNATSIVEDHCEWETDDEFMFTSTKIKETTQSTSTISNSDSECRSMTSTLVSASSLSGCSSLNRSQFGSTPYGYGAIPTLLYRNICILYSVIDPKIRAIVYDYDSKRSYFTTKQHQSTTKCKNNISSVPSGNSGCVSQQQVQILLDDIVKNRRQSESYRNTFIPDCVQAWKFMLLETYYADDEEDMYVSEDEILKLKHIETEHIITGNGSTLQRFKSVSSDNLLDIPQDKKSIGERFRNKLQRGVLKLNRSPKDKKGKLFSKRNDSTSLYLEDGVKPKYPIFGATLYEVEKDYAHFHVPKFVVDCVNFIEQKDCIQSDGLYRASGNKNAIDDLKKKLTESFVYDSKLLKNQDVHTVTGLLKLFFRELKTPLIPNEIYQKLPDNLSGTKSLSTIKKLLLSITNPSRGTLQYLIKHLTTVAYYSSVNRMPASNLAIIWGPCILFSVSTNPFDIARMNTLIKILIENYDVIFADNERLVN